MDWGRLFDRAVAVGILAFTAIGAWFVAAAYYAAPQPTSTVSGQTPTVTAPWWALVLIGLGVALSLAFLFRTVLLRRAQFLPVPAAGITLRFMGDMRSPTRLNYDNIFRWYYLRNMLISIDRQTGAETLNLIANLFVTFDKPVIIGTLSVTSPDMTLPQYEVKDFSPKSAVISFSGEVPAGTLIVAVHQ